MKISKGTWYAVGAVGLLVLLAGGAAVFSYLHYAKILIPQFEGFRANPYWDVSRYSWGYGTRAPGPTGTITREQALNDLAAFVQNDYEYLKPLIAVPLTPVQWAALLSFSYNLGSGNADNLVRNINNSNIEALQEQWNDYVYSDGSVNPDLVVRRAREFEIFYTNRL